jgi:hypothetical protein
LLPICHGALIFVKRGLPTVAGVFAIAEALCVIFAAF